MKKLNGTVTLSLLDEDNSQRVIFRIIPLCTREGLIFQNRKADYPDVGSLRIIPDKREQSSFKERMREMGSLCCVQLFTDGKELTKIRQNRNYDPNQGECNQYAIYSDVICGFEPEAVYEVFAEDADTSQALTPEVLVQRGMVLYGPVKREDAVDWDIVKPFGNESYLLHTVETPDGISRAYYWNPEATVTWRQRKKALKQNAEQQPKPVTEPMKQAAVPPTHPPIPEQPLPAAQVEQAKSISLESIPIGTKLDILDDHLTHDEQITGLNVPVSDRANLLEHGDKPKPADEQTEAVYFHGTPIAEVANRGTHPRQNESTVCSVVEKQIKEKHSAQTPAGQTHKMIQNPLENLKAALQDVLLMPSLHKDMIRLLIDNKELLQVIAQLPQMEHQARTAYTAAKAELDGIEAQRIALLVELDKVKADYQHTKEKMLEEITQKKQDEIALLNRQVDALKAEKDALQETLGKLGDELQQEAVQFIASKNTMMIASNGADFYVSPTIGYHFEPKDIVETVRAEMNALGFMCNQDCVTEFIIMLSLFDEIAIAAKTICIGEMYTTSIIQTLGLSNVTVWPDDAGTVRLLSLLPENDLRTPTLEVMRNGRIPMKAYGHKSIRLLDTVATDKATLYPVIQIPALNKDVQQDRLANRGKPISLQTLHSFSQSSAPMSFHGEAWFDTLSEALNADGIQVSSEIFHCMRMFARIATPQLVGGFTEAADAAVLAWVVPVLMNETVTKDETMKLLGDLPRSLRAIRSACCQQA